VAIDGCITKAPGGGELAGPSPVDRRSTQTRHEAVVAGRGLRHPARPGAGPGQPQRLTSPPTHRIFSTDLARCPTTSRFNWTRAMTPARPGTCWKAAAWSARSPARASKPPFRPRSAGTLSGRTHGTTPSPAWPAATNDERRSWKPSSASPTPSSPSVTSSAALGSLIVGTIALPGDREGRYSRGLLPTARVGLDQKPPGFEGRDRP